MKHLILALVLSACTISARAQCLGGYATAHSDGTFNWVVPSPANTNCVYPTNFQRHYLFDYKVTGSCGIVRSNLLCSTTTSNTVVDPYYPPAFMEPYFPGWPGAPLTAMDVASVYHVANGLWSFSTSGYPTESTAEEIQDWLNEWFPPDSTSWILWGGQATVTESTNTGFRSLHIKISYDLSTNICSGSYQAKDSLDVYSYSSCPFPTNVCISWYDLPSVQTATTGEVYVPPISVDAPTAPVPYWQQLPFWTNPFCDLRMEFYYRIIITLGQKYSSVAQGYFPWLDPNWQIPVPGNNNKKETVCD